MGCRHRWQQQFSAMAMAMCPGWAALLVTWEQDSGNAAPSTAKAICWPCLSPDWAIKSLPRWGRHKSHPHKLLSCSCSIAQSQFSKLLREQKTLSMFSDHAVWRFYCTLQYTCSQYLNRTSVFCSLSTLVKYILSPGACKTIPFRFLSASVAHKDVYTLGTCSSALFPEYLAFWMAFLWQPARA